MGPAVNEVPPEPKVAAPKVDQASTDLVERFRATENDPWAGIVGHKLEQWFQGAMECVPEGGKKELELSIEVGEELVGAGKLRLGIERKDGQYLVTVHGAGALGVGGLSKGGSAKVTGGVTGTATFRFGSSKEAADALSALVQTVPETGIGGPGGRLLGSLVRDDDAVARALHATGRLQSVELAGRVSGELSASSTFGDRKVTAGGEVNVTPGDVKLDLAKGELVISSAVDAGISGKTSREVLSKALVESNQLGNVKGTVSLEQHFPLSLQDIEQIQKGGTEALMEIAKDSARHSRTEVVVRLEGSVGGLEFKAERRGPPSEMLDAAGPDGHLLRMKDWSFQGFKVSGETSAGFDAGPLKVKAAVKDRQTVITGKGELAPLVQQGTSRVREALREEREVMAFRARAN
jgi:hypothetical protein